VEIVVEDNDVTWLNQVIEERLSYGSAISSKFGRYYEKNGDTFVMLTAQYSESATGSPSHGFQLLRVLDSPVEGRWLELLLEVEDLDLRFTPNQFEDIHSFVARFVEERLQFEYIKERDILISAFDAQQSDKTVVGSLGNVMISSSRSPAPLPFGQDKPDFQLNGVTWSSGGSVAPYTLSRLQDNHLLLQINPNNNNNLIQLADSNWLLLPDQNSFRLIGNENLQQIASLESGALFLSAGGLEIPFNLIELNTEEVVSHRNVPLEIYFLENNSTSLVSLGRLAANAVTPLWVSEDEVILHIYSEAEGNSLIKIGGASHGFQIIQKPTEVPLPEYTWNATLPGDTIYIASNIKGNDPTLDISLLGRALLSVVREGLEKLAAAIKDPAINSKLTKEVELLRAREATLSRPEYYAINPRTLVSAGESEQEWKLAVVRNADYLIGDLTSDHAEVLHWTFDNGETVALGRGFAPGNSPNSIANLNLMASGILAALSILGAAPLVEFSEVVNQLYQLIPIPDQGVFEFYPDLTYPEPFMDGLLYSLNVDNARGDLRLTAIDDGAGTELVYDNGRDIAKLYDLAPGLQSSDPVILPRSGFDPDKALIITSSGQEFPLLWGIDSINYAPSRIDLTPLNGGVSVDTSSDPIGILVHHDYSSDDGILASMQALDANAGDAHRYRIKAKPSDNIAPDLAIIDDQIYFSSALPGKRVDSQSKDVDFHSFTYELTAEDIGGQIISRDLILSIPRSMYSLPEPASLAVHRLFNPDSSRHLFSAVDFEIDLLTGEYGWIDEGVSFLAPTNGTTNIYRFFVQNEGRHFYTANDSERDLIRANPVMSDWQYEGIAYQGYSVINAPDDAIPVIRYFNESIGTHVYSTSSEEQMILDQRPDWTREGLAWFSAAN